MRKKIILLILSLLIMQCSFALNIVYPGKNEVTINSPSTFFIGSSDTDKELTINGESVEIHTSGGFAHPVKLNTGENKFYIKSGSEIKIYKILRPQNNTYKQQDKYIEYSNPLYGTIKKDNTPLRYTPVDAGINRMAQLQAGISTTIIGEKNGFYKIYLGNNACGWILKDHINITGNTNHNKTLCDYEILTAPDYITYIFHLTEPVPWEVSETRHGIKIRLFNIKNEENNIYTFEVDTKTLFNGKNLLGYQTYFSGNDFYLKIRNPLKINIKKPLDGIKIAIDPGHGGKEIGTTGCLGTKEKDFNLEYAVELKKVLESKGAEVYLTRDKDEYLGLNERVEFTNSRDIPVFISIHGNALPDTMNPLTNFGTEIYYFYNQSKPLAASIMTSLLDTYEIKNNGIKQASFAVIRNSNALALLIEIGYLINPAENAKIISPKFRKNTVKAIADGIEKYFENQK